MISAEKIIVALDTKDAEKLSALFKSLKGYNLWVKVGMEIFYSLGPKVIYEAKENGFKVFLDLKLHDIPNTVAQGLKSLSTLPVDMLNVHAAGGLEMMKAAAESIKSLPHSPLLIAVTQLTSTTQKQMNEDQLISGEILQSVVHFAKLARSAGLDGVVSSPLEVEAIKKNTDSKFLTITPGIRPQGSDVHDQKRVTTPMDAIRLGTDFMVIGRPITQSADPKEALESILKGN
jgi:orotidine-5'-phosphate decarboxylase